MVAMASDSYLLKVSPTPCQGCHLARASRSTPCGVVVTLVLMLAAILALSGLAYCCAVELRAVQSELHSMQSRLKTVHDMVYRLNVFEDIKAFEIKSATEKPAAESEEDEEYGSDDVDPVYPDDEEYDIVENKAKDREDRVVAPLQPAGNPTQDATPSPTTTTTAPAPSEVLVQGGVRSRREAPSRAARVVRAEPRLRLYHTLQTADQPPLDQHGYQPMYAEHAPTAFVTPPRHHQTPTTPASIASRRSRVMDGAHDDHYHYRRSKHGQRRQQRPFALQQHVEAPLDVPQGAPQVRRSPQPIRAQQPRDQRDQRGPWRGVRSIDASVDVEQTWRPYSPAVVEGPAAAAHFIWDAARARHQGRHQYDENGGRLKHPTGEYTDWRASDWVNELGLDHHFRLNESGSHVVVDTPGLYLVYAQVNYANDKDENGFWVYRNGQKELICATSGSSDARPRANTCFTAGVLHLSRGDRVALKDFSGDRYRVLDHPGRTFIGLVNLHGCKLKAEQPGRNTA